MNILKKLKIKKGVIQDYIIWIAIAVFILAIIIMTVLLMRGKGTSLLDKINNLFRFR